MEFILLFLLLFVYFLPAVVANSRGHANATAIFVLNLFLGWTLIGWVLSLVWALVNRTERVVYVREVQKEEPKSVPEVRVVETSRTFSADV